MVGPLCALLLWHSFTCARGSSPRIKIPPVVFAAVTAQQEKGIRLCGSGMREMHCNKTAFAVLCFVRRTTPRPAGTKHALPYSANSMERAHCTMRRRKKQEVPHLHKCKIAQSGAPPLARIHTTKDSLRKKDACGAFYGLPFARFSWGTTFPKPLSQRKRF